MHVASSVCDAESVWNILQQSEAKVHSSVIGPHHRNTSLEYLNGPINAEMYALSRHQTGCCSHAGTLCSGGTEAPPGSRKAAPTCRRKLE